MGGSRSAGCLALRGEGSLADGLAHLGRCTRSGRLPAMAPAALKDARPGPLDAAQDWGGGAGCWSLGIALAVAVCLLDAEERSRIGDGPQPGPCLSE